MLDDQIVEDAFTRMADRALCPHCEHVGFTLTWRKPDVPSFPIGGTMLGSDKIPHMKCKGCGIEVDGNVPR